MSVHFCMRIEFKLNIVLTGLPIGADKGIEGNGFKMLFGKRQWNFCSLRACFLAVGINSESLLGTRNW